MLQQIKKNRPNGVFIFDEYFGYRRLSILHSVRVVNFEIGQRVETKDGAEAMIVAIKPEDETTKPFSIVFTHPERHGMSRYHHSITAKRMIELFGASK